VRTNSLERKRLIRSVRKTIAHLKKVSPNNLPRFSRKFYKFAPIEDVLEFREKLQLIIVNCDKDAFPTLDHPTKRVRRFHAMRWKI